MIDMENNDKPLNGIVINGRFYKLFDRINQR